MCPVEQQIIKVRFEVKKVRYRNKNDGFTIIEAIFKEYASCILPTSEITIVGNFYSIFPEDEFEGEGYWNNHNVYGYNFVLKWNKSIIPQSQKGMEEFLKRYIKGLGGKGANRIVDCFREETLSIIENDWERLTEIPRVGIKLAQKIHEKLVHHKRYEEIALFVLGNGSNYKTALRIYEALGDTAIVQIRQNPYCLCKIHKIGFEIADKFAYSLGFLKNDILRIKEAINHWLELDVKKNGNLFLYKDDMIDKFLKLNGKFGAFYNQEDNNDITVDMTKQALQDLIKDEKIVVVKHPKEKDLIYLSRYYFMENKIVELLKKLINESKEPLCTKTDVQHFLDKHYGDKSSIKLATKQKEAVFMALFNGVSILTGGPGTGKTHIINTIIQCIKNFKPDATIHLCAPTGKASKRMTELTGMEAKTIHRLIGLNGFNENNEINEIEGDYLIVDETSMIDAYVTGKLLSAVSEDMRILFVGDYEQLPSVGAGLILRDLINSGKIPVTKLDKIFRQAKESQIVMNSHKIIRGIKTFDKDGLTFDISKGDFYFIENNDRIKIQDNIIKSVKRFLEIKEYTLNDIQILTPVKKGDLGTNQLNFIMQQNFNPTSIAKNEIKLSETSFFREGDRVIQTVNNYDLKVYNGEVGIINKIYYDENENVQVEVDYGDKIITHDELSLEDLMLAYAITIHKSQGSEFPIVIMPIHNSQEKMLNRNLVYTAWTRAKQIVVNIGQKQTLDKAIDKNDNTTRCSKIKEKIAQSF